MSDINQMTRADFEKLPDNKWNNDIGEFDTLIILPSIIRLRQVWWYWIRTKIAKVFSITKPEIWDIYGLHDSGYRCMNFIACKDDKPLCKLSGCSDVLHFDGIGGYGYQWTKKGGVPEKVIPAGWTIDCLPESGLLRIFCSGYIRAGNALSSFEIYCVNIEGRRGLKK